MTTFKDKILASDGKKEGEAGAYELSEMGDDLDLNFVNNKFFEFYRDTEPATGFIDSAIAISNAVVSIFLEGNIDETETTIYALHTYVNDSTTKRIRISEKKEGVSDIIVCEYLISQTQPSSEKEILEIPESGGSGITAKIFVDWSLLQDVNYILRDYRTWGLTKYAFQESYFDFTYNNKTRLDAITSTLKKTQTVVQGVDELTLLNWTEDGDTIISDGNTGWSSYAYYDANLNEDRFSQTVMIKATNTGDFEIGIGKRASLSGTVITLRKDATGSYLCFWRMSSQSAPVENAALRTTIPDLENDKYYMLKMKKDVNAALDTIAQIVYPDNTVYDFANLAIYANYSWGFPTIYCITGECTVSDFTFSYPYKKDRDPKLLVFGDSLIEGNTISGDKDKRYIALLAQDLGAEEVAIFAQGGESTTSVLDRFYTQVDWYEDANYALINLGGNDYASFFTYQSNINAMTAYLKSKNIIPILTTTCYRGDVDNSAFIAQANPWVRGLGELYLDLSLAVSVEGDETTWKSDYLLPDNVHPTITGHQGIYAYIKYQLQFLFNE